jgi:hypothetical protein
MMLDPHLKKKKKPTRVVKVSTDKPLHISKPLKMSEEEGGSTSSSTSSSGSGGGDVYGSGGGFFSHGGNNMDSFNVLSMEQMRNRA